MTQDGIYINQLYTTIESLLSGYEELKAHVIQSVLPESKQMELIEKLLESQNNVKSKNLPDLKAIQKAEDEFQAWRNVLIDLKIMDGEKICYTVILD
ncbi:hypothetical protein [Veillonella criceti]|uniref:Uncharacterized protein n=1 Tax=Veillonella criceti TaxID=103891 RepID=A0A380Q0X3_9FIRM|nr:hypothetical protein [Veillonella criceti]SUP79485.1 Uncharacterised protein [Veillonella criceti]